MDVPTGGDVGSAREKVVFVKRAAIAIGVGIGVGVLAFAVVPRIFPMGHTPRERLLVGASGAFAGYAVARTVQGFLPATAE